jgi:hypothetical protein
MRQAIKSNLNPDNVLSERDETDAAVKGNRICPRSEDQPLENLKRSLPVF